MRVNLLAKFLIIYSILAVLSLLVVTTLGKQLVTDELTLHKARELYAEATHIADSQSGRYFQNEAVLSELYNSLKLVSSANGASIRLIDTDGTELINTETPLNIKNPHVIKNFDYVRFGPKFYEVSRFYNQYKKEMLSVICPVTRTVKICGYISISLPMDDLQKHVGEFVRPMEIICGINFLLSFVILGAFWYYIYRPLAAISYGAGEFARGNLTHRIDVASHDEMGYLADTLNLMAGELRKNNDYQKNFISNISHDFRSPLTSIKGFTEAMVDGTIPPELHDKYLGIIAQETDRLDKLTRSVLELNTLNAGKASLNYSDFDVNEMLKSTLSVFEGSCRKKKITISLVQTGTSLLVHADKEKIEQVIYNLLDNAVKFSERNSQIKVETTIRHNKCHVSIRDEGCGISQDSLPKIWDRFYKEDASRGRDRKGTGLGLSIVKDIITAHGQTISVVSTAGVGTEFVFTLELA
ncbi:MAG: HAMP domain-containing sensor histidine kinase [Lachnospiraceae bacterium]|nr:HAMP domain-containing sensor histidine kinase [Lachnospiraceae bacterium]